MGGVNRDRDARLRRIAYDPLPSQKKFHDCKERFKGFSGPIGSGKSAALCHEAIRLSYLNAGRLGLIGAPTYPMLRDATQASLFELLEQNAIPYEHNKAENTMVFKDTGSRVLLRSMEEYERLRGTNLAWFGVDELTYTAEEAWLRLEGRLRDPRAKMLTGFGVWTPKGFDWVYRKFVADPKPSYYAIMAAPAENRHMLSQIPDFYARLKDSYDERFYQQEVLGAYLSLDGGRVYAAFNRAEHVQETRVDPYQPLRWALDFNVDPMSSVIVQTEPGRAQVVGEIYLRNGTTQRACETFLERHGKHPSGVVVYGDASGYQHKTTGGTDYEVIKEYFAAQSNLKVSYRAPRSNPGVKSRINLVNRQFRSASGIISLTVDPKCKELIQDLEQVCFKSDSGEIDKDKDRMRTHLSDALGYVLWQECQPLPPYGYQGMRLIHC